MAATMTAPVPFQTLRLACRPPDAASAPVYRALFADEGPDRLAADRTEWDHHGVAPWTLSHAGRDIGVGGFRIGFGCKGLELRVHLLHEIWGDGLASEFVTHALDYATDILRETDVFAVIGPEHQAALRILEKSGFAQDPSCKSKPSERVMCWRHPSAPKAQPLR